MKSSSFWLGILAGIIVAALIGLLALPTIGVFDMTATGDRNILDWWGETNIHSVISRSAPETTIPDTADPAEGFEHYRSTCLICHGAPDAPREQWADHMLPKPPQLWQEVQEYSDGELFFIVNNGIRMTGMPAFGPGHPEEDIWNIIAFLRQFASLTEEQKQLLQQAAAEGGHGSDSGGSGHSHQQ